MLTSRTSRASVSHFAFVLPRPALLRKHLSSDSNMAQRTIVVPALKKHTATIICLHGLGDSGTGWTFLAENWQKRGKLENVKFVFPSAPSIPITVNGGMKMPGWYDIANFDTLNRSDDEPGILKSRKYIYSLIQEQRDDGIPAKRIILGGFSQGGAMSIFSGLTYTKARLGGIFGLSCYQLMPAKFDELRAETGTQEAIQQKPPVFMGHGEEDPLVKPEWGQKTAEGLKEKGFDVEWHTYPGLPHSADPKEIDDLEAWVTRRLDETEENNL